MKRLRAWLKLIIIAMLNIQMLTSLAAKEVSVAVYDEHDKYVAVSAAYGVSWKLMELAAKSQQIVLVPQQISWQGGMNRLRTAKVDLVFPAFKTTERETWGLFTLPLLLTGSAIFTDNNNPISELSQIDFENASVGVSADSVQECLAREVGFKHVYAIKDRAQLYSMLQEKRIDYVFFAIAAVNYYCVHQSKLGSSNCLKQIGVPYGVKSAHAVSLNSPESKAIIDLLNTGFLAIKDSQEVAGLFAQYQYSEQDLQSWRASLNSQ
ncbi:substrate-binding periplasmic protein [Aliiglaciecola litoralis]